jgi:hypothetical protein
LCAGGAPANEKSAFRVQVLMLSARKNKNLKKNKNHKNTLTLTIEAISGADPAIMGLAEANLLAT